ncbi:hypothetical protein ACS0TY_018617 [Phlomoides rotata]
MEIMDREFCKIFWEDDEFYWAYNGSTGMSGGLLCTWRSSCFIMESCLDRTGALEIKGFWGENKVKCSVVNVYMPCIRTRRYEIFDEWNNIYPLYEDYILCFAGDFNTVRTSCERKGRGMATSFQECDKFNDFISTCGLEELSLRGRKYTWYKEDGSAMSRIDRVLINEIGFENWSSISLSALPRTLSDHCPIFTRNRTIDWGPKPFKVKNSWFLLRDYDNMIEDFWNKTCIQGTAGFIFKEKLKLLKSELRVWDRKNCSTMEHKAEEAKKKISELDMKAEAVDLSAEEIEVRKDCFQTFKDAKLSKNIMLFQQSRDKWIKDGEENSKFFHAIINQRRKINNINGIFMGGSWVEGVEATKVAIKDHFQNAFTEESWSVSPKLNNLEFKQIDSEESNMLTPLELERLLLPPSPRRASSPRQPPSPRRASSPRQPQVSTPAFVSTTAQVSTPAFVSTIAPISTPSLSCARCVTGVGGPLLRLFDFLKSFLELTEYSREEILGRNCRFLQGPETDPATVRKIREAINNQKEVTVQLINYTKTSKKFWNLFHLQPMRDQKVHRACAEREILNMLDHPFLPALYASFQTKTHICLITDYCPGGELFLLLDRQPTKVLKEDAVRPCK